MLRKKRSGVAKSPQSSSFIGKVADKIVDRRAFLRGSGLAIGGLTTAVALSGANVRPAQAAAAGAASIVQPGGSIRDQEVIDAANRLGVSMLFTGHRLFRH